VLGFRGMSTRAGRWYLLGAVVLLLSYATVTTVLWTTRSWSETGPLSFGSPALASVPPRVAAACRSQDTTNDVGDYKSLKIVGGAVTGHEYYGCYAVSDDGTVWGAAVLDAAALTGVSDPAVLKAGGAWRWIATVKDPADLLLGGVGLAAILVLCYGRRRRPGRRRAVRVVYGLVLGGCGLGVGAFAFVELGQPDPLELSVAAFLVAALLWGWLGARALVPPRTRSMSASASLEVSGESEEGASSRSSSPSASSHASFLVQPPGDLPDFSRLGGMEDLKAGLRSTIGVALAYGPEADSYGVRFGGILLHGNPGTGKSYLARATAGEFGLNFLPVSTGDLVSRYLGDTARNIEEAFRTAARHPPCLLFFDEFDSVAARRGEDPDQENRRSVNQLLTSLERHRGDRELIVMAATNDPQRLDPAVTRRGRFDRAVRVDLPDRAAREAILRAAMTGRPAAPDLDPARVADRTDGLTAAALAALVDTAAAAALAEFAQTGNQVRISTAHLTAAIDTLGGKDRPTLAPLDWDQVVLDEATARELKELTRVIEDPERARRYGVTPPSGLLLAGPPGTGKTTVARVLAARTKASFYPLSTADLTAVWVGEAERRVRTLFERARENAPSIIFLDEVEAVAARRDVFPGSPEQRVLTQLLAEIDGVGTGARPVFVLAATNHPQMLDPALTRGGRLSRTLYLPLPDRDARRRLLALHTRAMPLAPDADLDALAAATDGFSGADLAALVQQAALHAMSRAPEGAEPRVTQEDLDAAAGRLAESDPHHR
jgi:transitional endoplasmic reticulum ATPase